MERHATSFYVDAFIAVCALLALFAVFDQLWELAYGWLGCGCVARLAWDARADQDPTASLHRSSSSADFALQVIVPLGAMSYAGFLEGTMGTIIAAVAVFVSMYRLNFEPQAAPVSVYHGLPLIWPSVGFLLSVFDATPVAAALAIGLVAVLNLWPLPWPHPLRCPRWQAANNVVLVIALAANAAALWLGFRSTPPALKSIFVLIAVYASAVTILNARATTTNAPRS